MEQVLAFGGVAFLAGLVSCVSSCVLPLLPGYVSYLGGTALSNQAGARRQLFARAGLFVLGFTSVFVVFGASAGIVGRSLAPYRTLLQPLGGALLILLGVLMLGIVKLPWLSRTLRFDIAYRLPRGRTTSYLVGLSFGVGWTPCVGPVLGVILTLAAASATAWKGALLLAIYSLGLAVPFLLLAFALEWARRGLRTLGSLYPVVSAFSGLALIGVGLLIFTDNLTLLYRYVPIITPPI